MKPSWCLPALAALFLGGALWITLRGPRFVPAQVAESARARLAALPSDEEAAQKVRSAARRELDLALRRTTASHQGSLRAELLGLRAELNEDEGLYALALEDARARLELGVRDPETLARTAGLLLRMGEPGQALAFATELALVDPARGRALLGQAHVALAARPLDALERLMQAALTPARAILARTLARRAAALGGDEALVAPAREEFLALFARPDQRRAADEWLREAGQELRAARAEFVASLERGTTSRAVAGLQELCQRAGRMEEAGELGLLALSHPDLAEPLDLLLGTLEALVDLDREPAALALLETLRKRLKGKFEPDTLPSDGPRDALEAWCRVLERLGAWNELGAAAWTLLGRALDDRQRAQRAQLLMTKVALRQRNLETARKMLDLLGLAPLDTPEENSDLWLLRSEHARARESRLDERFALLSLQRSAPLDPSASMRREIGLAMERLAELQLADGELLSAAESLTHALRLAGQAPALEKRWHEVGTKAAAAAAGLPSAYGKYQKALWALRAGNFETADDSARELLALHPGLGPALEVASEAALGLRNYARMVATSLEILERGLAPAAASARLRLAPRTYLLPQDRVRWFMLDPRGSLGAVLGHLSARRDTPAAARAARTVDPAQQPPEILPLLAETLAVADPRAAYQALARLAVESPLFGANAGRLLSLATELAEASPEALATELERVLLSGPPRDPDLVGALSGMIAAHKPQEAARLAAWMMDERTPFLAEALLARTVLDALAGQRESESLERAAALLADGRPELGRLILLAQAGDGAALREEARAALTTPLAGEPGRELALLLLAGEDERAARRIAEAPRDGRSTAFELASLAAGLVAPEALTAAGVSLSAPAFLGDGLAPELYLLLVLAAELPPWSVWCLTAGSELSPAAAGAPELVQLQALAALALGRTSETARALDGLAGDDARSAWLRARLLRERGAEEGAVRAAELDWLERSGRAEEASPELAPLQAALAERRGDPQRARELLEQSYVAGHASPALLEALARLEDTPGRRVRAFELYSELLATTADPSDPRVLTALEVLRRARDEGELSERRWWAEVEALEAARPSDPAPVRELATRSFEQPESEGDQGRAHALARLERFRERTLHRPIEGLRAGEALRWTRLLARFTPEGAADFATDELHRDPADPRLWHASAEAELAAGRPREAIARLEAISHVAPERETTRLLIRLRYGLDRNTDGFLKRLMALRRMDPEAKDDPELLFIGYVADAEGPSGLRRALRLWSARERNGLASVDHGRLLALALHENGARQAALTVLEECGPLARTALERDVLSALARLIQGAPTVQSKASATGTTAADDAIEADPSVERARSPDARQRPSEKPKKPRERKGAAGAVEAPQAPAAGREPKAPPAQGERRAPPE